MLPVCLDCQGLQQVYRSWAQAVSKEAFPSGPAESSGALRRQTLSMVLKECLPAALETSLSSTSQRQGPHLHLHSVKGNREWSQQRPRELKVDQAGRNSQDPGWGQHQLEFFWSPVSKETGELWDEYMGLVDIITAPSVFRACSPMQVNL